MAAFIPFANIVQVNLRYTMEGQQCENTFHNKSTVAWTAPNMTTLAAIYYNWVDTDVKPLMVSDCVLQSIAVQDLTTQTSQGVDVPAAPPIVGTAFGDPMPMNVTVAVKLNSLFRGRNWRGRSYFIGIPDPQVSGSFIDATYAANLATAYNTLIATLSAASWPLHVASRWNNRVRRTIGATAEIVAASVELTVDSQRRRLPGRGR
jgi:hypothetical protein